MGHSHEHRPYISRRQFLKRAAVVGGSLSAGPFFWRQLAYAADAPPSQLHATFGRSAASEMSLSWMTPAAVEAPFVHVAGERFAAQTSQYAGYPGFFHHVRLQGLDAGASYAYEVGHAGASQTTGASFTTGPAAGSPFTFTAFGDQGVDPGQPPNQPGANTDLAASLDPAFHIIVGDLAYANGDQAIWDAWFDLVSPMARSKPWMPLIGNHEIESSVGAGGIGGGDSWGAFGYDAYRTRFALPSNGISGLENCFYAFRYGSVHFVCIDNNDVNTEITANIGYTGGRQVQFVEAELAAARRDPTVDFIVVAMHQCAFSSSSKHGSDAGVQQTWFDMFRRYSVDLVLQGHDHTYERSHAMVGDEVVGSGPVYNTDVGTVYVVCGNGGAVQEPFNPLQPAWSAFRQALKVGTLKIDVQPNGPDGKRRLLLSEHWALDGSVIEDGIVLERSAPAASPEAAAPLTAGDRPAPSGTLPATGGPAGTALLGVAAGAAGLALRTLTREERRQELADSR